MSVNSIIRRRQVLILAGIVLGAVGLILLPKLFGGDDVPIIRAPADISILRLDDTVSAEDRWLDNAEQQLHEMTTRLDVLEATNTRLQGENKELRDKVQAITTDAEAMIGTYEELIADLVHEGSGAAPTTGAAGVIPPPSAVPTGTLVSSPNTTSLPGGSDFGLPINSRQEFTLTSHVAEDGLLSDLYIPAGAHARGDYRGG